MVSMIKAGTAIKACIKNGMFFEEVWKDVPYESISGIRIKEILYQGSSDYQDLLIFDSIGYGRVLTLDGCIQLTEYDEFSYHETMAFTALSCHKEPKKVLIVGGGDGGMAREVLKFPTIESITVCDIDEEVVNMCKKFFPSLSKSFQHPKVHLVIDDAFKFLANKESLYDVIICDTTDPDGEDDPDSIFGEEFYDMIRLALKPNGVLLSQTGNNMWQPNLKCIQKICTERFPVVSFGFVSVASTSNSQNGFIICGKDKNLQVRHPYWQFSDEQLVELGMQYYNSDMHQASFMLPSFFKKYLKEDVTEQADMYKWIKKNDRKLKIENGKI